MDIEFGDQIINVDSKAIASLTRLQARWRGRHVRNQMCKLRHLYEQLFADTEGDTRLVVGWQDSVPGRPRIGLESDLLAETRRKKKNSVTMVTEPNGCHGFSDGELNKNNGDIAHEDLIATGEDRNNKIVNSNQETDDQNDIKSLVSVHSQDGAISSDKQESIKSIVSEQSPDGSPDNVSDNSVHSDSSKGAGGSKTSSHHGSETASNVNNVPGVESENALVDNNDNPTPSPSSTHPGSEEAASPVSSEAKYEELSKQRNDLAMELLWIQQAIDSRKQYLRLKTQIGDTASPE